MGGIEVTFKHQNNNGLISKNGLWRKGKLCLNNPYESISVVECEPSNYEDKLYWNVCRAVEWIFATAKDILVSKGDYYEIPDFNTRKINRIIYSEDIVSKMEWEEVTNRFGYVDLICTENEQYFAETFISKSGNICKTTRWGDYIGAFQDKIVGAWIMLKSEPILNVWQAPNNFNELKIAFQNQGLDLKSIFKELFPRFRDRKKHVVMIGFPIPEKIGMEPSIIHWEAFILPTLSSGTKFAKGFRNNEEGWQMRDFQQIVTGENEIEWSICENWNASQILNRGHFDRRIMRKKILLIGAGTLGASIGEYLVRGGIYNLTIMDDDIYSIGNSARHVLGIDSVGKYKAQELGKRYNAITPNAFVKSIEKAITRDNVNKIIDEFDVILDCTASNEVLKILSENEARTDKVFISISFGYEAEVLFFAYQKGKSFDLDSFLNKFGVRMRENEQKVLNEELPWDGIGCWSPVFPAMACDIQLIASFSTQIIKKLIENNLYEKQYYIYQKQYDQDGVMTGFVRV